MSRFDRRAVKFGLGAQDALLLLAVVALPWFWGGVYLDSYGTAAALVACAAGLALVQNGFSGLGLGRCTLWLLPAFLLGAFALAQTIPLPRAWVEALSPKAASIQTRAYGSYGLSSADWLRQIENEARALVPDAPNAEPNRAGPLDLGPDAPAPPRGFTLSLRPGATRESFWWYVTLLLAFLLVLRRTENVRRAAVYRAVLFAFFGVLATVAMVNHITSPRSLVWIDATPEEAHSFGPYVNPSHFGGVMELAVPWLLGYGLWRLTQGGESDRQRLAGALALAAAAIGAAGTFLSASKMATLTVGVASVILIALAFRRVRSRRLVLAIAAVAAIVLGAIAGFGPLRGRIADFAAVHEGELSPNFRRLAWTAGWHLAKDFPLTGSGFNALPDLIAEYLPAGESERWSALHNDYLEVYVAGGLIGAALATWLTLAFLIRVLRSLKQESARDRLLPAMGLMLGLFAMAAHEAVDFNLQIPANALLFVVIAALGVSSLAESVEAT